MDISTLAACAAPLEQAAQAREWQGLKERDLQSAVSSVTGAGPRAIKLAHWPAVGPVDVVQPDGVALELKWCRSGDTLGNCAWDIAKLACATAEGQVTEGHIVAGAPASHWESDADGVDLFAPRVYEDDALTRGYESWWRFWCRDVLTRPVDLPRVIAVSEPQQLALELGGTPFVLRSARVEVVDPAWRAHVCPHRWRGERCRPRGWDPEGWGGLPA